MDRTLTRRGVLALAAGAAIAPIVARLPFADPVAAADDDIDITAATIVRYFDRIPIEDVRAFLDAGDVDWAMAYFDHYGHQFYWSEPDPMAGPNVIQMRGPVDASDVDPPWPPERYELLHDWRPRISAHIRDMIAARIEATGPLRPGWHRVGYERAEQEA